MLFGIFSIVACPVLFLHGIGNVFGWLSDKAYWWNLKGCYTDKAIDLIFIIVPSIVGLHWLIVAIWFPNLYK